MCGMRHPGAPAKPQAPVRAPARAPVAAQGAGHLHARPGRPWTAWWLELSSAVLVVIICTGSFWTAPLLLAPLLAVPPALAGIGAATVRRPLGFGAVSLLAAVVVARAAGGDTHF